MVLRVLYQVLVFELGLRKEDVFLDTEGLSDLHMLRSKVLSSDTLVCLLTKGYLTRPWCLIEMAEAIKNNIPLKTIFIEGAGYSFEDMAVLLKAPDAAAALDALNPDASATLAAEGFDAADVFQTIGGTLPYIIAKNFDPTAPLAVKKAQLADALGL